MFYSNFAILFQPPEIVVLRFNPKSTELRNINFQPLEVVSRYRNPQLQVTENLCYL